MPETIDIEYEEKTQALAEKYLTFKLNEDVSAVLESMPAESDESPASGASVNTSFSLGIAQACAGVKILLDIDRALGSSASSAVAALFDAA